MNLAILVSCVILFVFGVVVFFGAPYLPTLRPQIAAALDLLDLKKGETLLELGSGDGRVLLEAAKRGYYAVGVELNLVLVLIALWRTRHYRTHVRVIWGNYWRIKWPESNGVFTFLADSYMQRLNERMVAYGGLLASVAFKIPHRSFVTEKDGVYLYRYDKPLAPHE